MTSPLRALRAAFIFLTRVPVGGFPFEPAEWRWAASWFPFVGAAVGAATAGVFVALRGMGSLAAALLAIGASLLLTGAFHEDGLADTSDALGGATDRAKIFLILKDSRVGSFGASALILSLAGRAALLAQLHAHPLEALVLTGSIARAAAVWQMATLPYATPEGAKSREVSRAGPTQAAIASVWPLAFGAALVAGQRLEAWRLVAVVAVSAAITLVTGWRYMRRAGGATGDFLGATEQLCELGVLGVLAWSPT